MVPGTCLRRARERLGLTYRDVERSSYELAKRRGRSDFIIRVSRLADFENGGVTPSLYKLYSLCAIYHLDVFEVCEWYSIPLRQRLRDSLEQPTPRTHLLAVLDDRPDPSAPKRPLDSERTSFLALQKGEWDPVAAALTGGKSRYRLGFIGTEDHWMEPLLRPGSLVLLDPARRRIDDSGWPNEFERPIYFIELRQGYRCCWCQRDKDRLILLPHPLSPCLPETLRFPDEAEVAGQVVGMAMRLFGS